MGREIRMVPPGWRHPRDKRGNFIPLLKMSPGEYDAEKAAFERRDLSGLPSYFRAEYFKGSFRRWAGARSPKRRMPDFEPGTATHLMMYESTSEGTPISPAFATAEELARWLADTGASAFGAMTATYAQWLATCRAGWAPSAIGGGGMGLISGVEASLLGNGAA